MRILLAALALSTVSIAVSAATEPSRSLVRDAVINSKAMPKSLSEFGFFTDAAGRKPNQGVQLYRLNSALFTDYADKYRYIYIPAGQQAIADGEGLLQFPVGSALIKSFGYKIDGQERLLETRVLLHRAEGWVALPYVWNTEQTEAILKVAGKRLPVRFTDPSGQQREISYAVPNKNQCKECHALSGAVTPIGPKARNLTHDTWDILASNALLDQRSERYQPIADYADEAMPLESRARAYLDINCAHCHNREGSASNSGLFLTYEEAQPVHLGVGKRPVAAGRGSGGLAFSIAPGQPDQSIMMYRLKSLEPGVAMPEVGRSLVHEEGVALLDSWIRAMQK
ncbi:MAG: SO2930 family diheme c-type cytochrome [Parasphingorhabdus sp.]|uniref:SO2930 family diheme c-type cytochrome n=1 Tax=Parasphingorhabdus sp. TaxID=2709688 RepID=UPI003299F182